MRTRKRNGKDEHRREQHQRQVHNGVWPKLADANLTDPQTEPGASSQPTGSSLIIRTCAHVLLASTWTTHIIQLRLLCCVATLRFPWRSCPLCFGRKFCALCRCRLPMRCCTVCVVSSGAGTPENNIIIEWFITRMGVYHIPTGRPFRARAPSNVEHKTEILHGPEVLELAHFLR